MKMDNEEIINGVASKLIEYYKSNKQIFEGINGPYDDPETRVRNLSHLIVIVCIMNQRTGGYSDLLNIMADDLKSNIEENGLYKMRKKPGKDQSNGVIGHAWVIEALTYLYKNLNDESCLSLAVDLAGKHIFSKEYNLWYIPVENGKSSEIDLTLNHQLWYAASLAELNSIVKSDDIKLQVNSFMDNLPKICKTSVDGKIAHSIYFRDSFGGKIKGCVKRAIDLTEELLNLPSMTYKEQGYHVFNLMALARLYILFPQAAIFNSSFFEKVIKYVNSQKFFEGLHNSNISKDKSLHNNITDSAEKNINIYGYPYNVPGFELEYISEVFKDYYPINKHVVENCMKEQIELTFSDETLMFTHGCHDKWAVNYRTYEYYRYLEIVK